jgi:hypothetical protein
VAKTYGGRLSGFASALRRNNLAASRSLGVSEIEVDRVAVAVDGAKQVHLFSTDVHNCLVHVPGQVQDFRFTCPVNCRYNSGPYAVSTARSSCDRRWRREFLSCPALPNLTGSSIQR